MSESFDPAENSQTFFRFFQQEIISLQQQMERLGDTALVGGERIDATAHCQAGLARLSKEIQDASVYIPVYDQRSYAQAMKALQDRFEQSRTAHAPRQKFSFKNARKNPSAISLNDVAHITLQRQPDIPAGESNGAFNHASVTAMPDDYRTSPNALSEGASYSVGGRENHTQGKAACDVKGDAPSHQNATSAQITNQQSAHILSAHPSRHASITGAVSHVNRCVVDVSASATAEWPFAGLILKDVKKSILICGHVEGSAHITSLTDCVIVVACRQFRMHECRRCDVYLEVASRPVVENVDDIRFAPLPDIYVSESQHQAEEMWDKVDDFKWLKNEHSPHWSIIAETDRISELTWRDYLHGRVNHGVEDILSVVGIGGEIQKP